MTPNELTDIISLELGVINDFVFKRTILARANAVRAQQMKRSLEKTPQDRKYFLQAIQVPLENYNLLDGVADFVCMQSRSSCEIPEPIRANSILYDYVGAIDGSNAYRYTTPGAGKFISAGRYASPAILYWKDATRIYVNRGGVPKILVTGIFSDPEKAYEIDAKTRACVNCDFWESRYPCSEDVLDIIITEITTRWKTNVINQEVNGTQNRPDPTA